MSPREKRLAILAALLTVPLALLHGCGEDDATPPGGGTPDATAEGSASTDSGTDATGSSDTGGNVDTGQPDAGQDANVLSEPCRTVVILDAGADADANVDAGDADPATVPAAARETFANGMVGCKGTVAYPKRGLLCNATAGCAPCTATEWVANSNQAPAHNYWVDDALRYTGKELRCGVTLSLDDSEECDPETSPMRVCMDGDGGIGNQPRSVIDESGNGCNWTHCGLDIIVDAGPDADAGPITNAHFGGCDDNLTAGTLCCCQ